RIRMIRGSRASREGLGDVREVNGQSSSLSSHPMLAPESNWLSSSEQAPGSSQQGRFVGLQRCICGKQLKCLPPLKEHCFVRVHPKQVRISRNARERRRAELVDARRAVFVTISSGNFLPEADVKETFSKLGDVATVRWSRFGLSNGYIITFKSRQHMMDALKVTGSRLEMRQCILSVKWAKPERIEWRICISLGGGKSLKSRLSLQLSDATSGDMRLTPVSASELKKITINHHRTQYLQQQSESPEVLSNVPGIGALALPAPYHLLPNTPYFQTAVIVPPPIR
uniref:RRM domain-containing protein n=1 Tax=Parascaris univalens TaxID=6257 RepID=A0A915BSW8_PARUN